MGRELVRTVSDYKTDALNIDLPTANIGEVAIPTEPTHLAQTDETLLVL